MRTVEAVPTFKVTHRYVDETAARRATQSKEIYGYLVIPTGFTADAIAGRQATLAYYYHYALLSVGGECAALSKPSFVNFRWLRS